MKTFHESWYRIANQRIALRPAVKVVRQTFRGAAWYVLQEPFNNQFYRLKPETYRFISLLDSSRTVEEAWKESADQDPVHAPGQEEVIELLAQLYHANLLHYHLPPDSVKLFERYKKKKQRILKANLTNVMFLRIPLFDPDAFLQRMMPLIRILISPAGLVLWLAAVVWGLKTAMDNFSALQVQSQGILSPSNLFLLYAGLVSIKTLHEFGHAAAVRRFGGEVHVMGVLFMIFTPLPYMDATAAWSFRNKWKRIFVGAAGMIFETFIASCAVLVWAYTGPGALHSLAYNMIFVASVSTLLFNINPLLRYDGYYMLSDFLDIPNLHQRASQYLIYLVERYAFGCVHSQTDVQARKEAFWLTTFSILSGIYRIVVFGTILLFVADRFLLAGIIMAVVCAVVWVAAPVIQIIRYLAFSPKLQRTRARAAIVCTAGFVVVFGFTYWCPFPYSVKAPGVLKAVEYAVVTNKVSGYVDKIIALSGARIQSGDLLLRLKNTELTFKETEAQAGFEQAKSMHQKALHRQQADLKPVESQMDYFAQQLEVLDQERKNLEIRSGINGVWVAPELENYAGTWVPRGTPLGQLINDKQFYFVAVVSQQDVSQLFSGGVRAVEVKLFGQSEISIPVHSYNSIPMEKTHLPSPALGWGAGGDVAIDTHDQKGIKTAEPFYEVRALINKNSPAALLHGRSGRIRFQLVSKPLFQQGWIKLRQLIQKRYQV